MKRRAHVVEVRRSVAGEWCGSLAPAWVAIDSAGRRFGGDDEAQARRACERYNAGKSPLYPGSAARTGAGDET